MADFYAIPTDIGEAKIANALALGVPLQITHLAVGDGAGAGAQGTPLPNPAQTALVSERRRAAINTLAPDASNANVIIAEQVIPEDVGGWWIREMAVFDVDGDMIAVCNTPPTYKPVLSSGSGRTQVVRMALIVADVAAVTLKIDPATVLATRQYVDSKTAPLAPIKSPAFTNSPTAPTPPQFDNDTSLATTGFVQRALGNISGTAAFSESVTLTAEDVGKGIISTESGITITLPPSETVAIGSLVHVLCATGTVTVQAQGADTIDSPKTSIVLGSRDTVVLRRSGSNWHPLYGSAALRSATDFGSSLSVIGFQRLPSGLIIQWGNSSTGSATGLAVSFPVAFPGACRCVQVTDLVNAGDDISGSDIKGEGAISDVTATGFKLHAEVGANWFAIGY